MLFYRNLFVYSRVFFAFEGKLPSPPYPVNLIQSLSFKSTRPRELLATWPRVQIQIVSRGSDELWRGEIFFWKYRWKKCNYVVRVRLQAGHLQWPKTEAGPRLHPSHTLTWSQMGTIIHSRGIINLYFSSFSIINFPCDDTREYSPRITLIHKSQHR